MQNAETTMNDSSMISFGGALSTGEPASSQIPSIQSQDVDVQIEERSDE